MNKRKIVGYWLLLGVFLVFIQIVVGGITRLTGSGLSITKWEIVTGTLPPMSVDAWQSEFDLYKATPQYEKINDGMSLKQFKFIYFWEYIHRLWARFMGLAFIIPFAFFFFKGWLDKKQLLKISTVFIMASVVAAFGWIMVASGLIERPWVNAYKLTMHLNLALILYAYLLWITCDHLLKQGSLTSATFSIKPFYLFGVLLFLQLIFGGVMSGMKAGLFFPTWPDMNGVMIPDSLSFSNWSLDKFTIYDSDPSMFALAFFQFFHRGLAYLLTILGSVLIFKNWNRSGNAIRTSYVIFAGTIVMQVLLGIVTVVSCKGRVPVDLGIYHQMGAIFLLSMFIILLHQVKNAKLLPST